MCQLALVVLVTAAPFKNLLRFGNLLLVVDSRDEGWFLAAGIRRQQRPKHVEDEPTVAVGGGSLRACRSYRRQNGARQQVHESRRDRLCRHVKTLEDT